jgi:hypothetical protein
MPLTTTGRNKLLDSGKNTAFSHVGALIDLTPTETSGGAYARQAITWAAAASGAIANSGSITIPINAGQTIVAISLHDAVSAGNVTGYQGINSSATKKGVGSVTTTGTTHLITSSAHGLATDDRIMFWPAGDAALPAGLSAGTLYFVLAAGLTADVFRVSTTSGGAGVNITATGELAFGTTVPQTFAISGNLTIANAALGVDLTFA